jgi:regulator of protease activity HflC (stomatin/prohibitin superfamily)
VIYASTRRGSALMGALVVLAIICFILLILLIKCSTTVDPGNVGVVKVFGKIESDTLTPGYHLISPFADVVEFNCKAQTFQEEALPVPASDELVTDMDVSVQFSFDPAHAVESLKDTGTEDQLIHVHLEPKMRSALREAGKSVKESEDFFRSEVQVRLQANLRDELAAYLAPKGILVSDVLLRNIKLPDVVIQAVQAKKQREQATLTQQAELARFTVEQQQKVATAQAEMEAAKQQAE